MSSNAPTNPAANAVATPRTEQRSIVEIIRSPAMQQQIAASLPPSVPLDRFTATTVTALNHNPELINADRQSLYNAIVKAAQEGLMPDGVEGVLNIYSTNVAPRNQPPRYVQKVQWQRMVQGIIKQFAKAGLDAYAISIHQNELGSFRLWSDADGQHFTHEAIAFGEKGQRVGALAWVKLKSGRLVVQAMDMDALEKARKASKAPDGPWKQWPDRMEQKSALHRLRKRVAILDEEAAQHLNRIDDEFEDEDLPDAPTPPPVEPVSSAARPASLQSVVDQAPSAAAGTTEDSNAQQPGDVI